jgi:polysaccharide biosynthesis/export protein
MRTAKFCMTTALLFCIPICSAAQHQAAQEQNDSLLIGPGDMIAIQVLEAPEVGQHVRVTDEGKVQLILGGHVKVAGLTPSQAAAVVDQALKDGNFVLNPHATVTIEQYATQNVTIMGQVNHPGSYPIGTPRSVLDVLALAGGATDLADRNITIERHKGGERVQYFLSNQSKDALDSNAQVYPGDIVLVPKIDVVYVMGDVPRPGGYPMATNNGTMSVLQAVALAGSPAPSAKSNQTRLIRKQTDGSYVEMPISLHKMQRGERADVLLRPDDIIYVPFSYLKNIGSSLGGIVSAAGSAAIYHY